MEIRRQGSNRKTGWTPIKSKKALISNLEADAKGNVFLSLGLKKTTDIDRSGEYDYDVRLSIADLAMILDGIASKGVEHHQEALMEGLQDSVRSLTRLAAVASGVPLVTSGS